MAVRFKATMLYLEITNIMEKLLTSPIRMGKRVVEIKLVCSEFSTDISTAVGYWRIVATLPIHISLIYKKDSLICPVI